MTIYSTEALRAVQAQLEVESLIRRQLLGMPSADPRQQWVTLVAQKEASGLGRVAAITAAIRERHDLFEQQTMPKSMYLAARR